jgi:urate oxidase
MDSVLAANGYGKSGVRLVKVERDGARHTIRDYTVATRLEGNYRAAHVDGDNSAVLPTDSMKNAVYALAAQMDITEPERFALRLAEHLLANAPAANLARIEIVERAWMRMQVGGVAHDHAFERGSSERRTATLSLARGGTPDVEAGISDLVVLKSTQSAFAGFPRDQYTTLRETTDRIFATAITARWRYASATWPSANAWRVARTALVETFAQHDSQSVQHTLFAMGDAALQACPEIVSVHLSLPNKHHLLVDLSPFGVPNENTIFVATDEPYGLIEAEVKRRD